MNSETPMDGPELDRPEQDRLGPPVSGRGGRVISRALIVLGIVAVGGFGYLLGARLTSANSAASQGGFGGGGTGGGGTGGAAGAGRAAGARGAARPGAAGGAAARGSGAAGGARASGGGYGGAGRGAATSVQTVVARSGALIAQRTTAGTVVPTLQSSVAAQAGGVVQQLLQPVGASVKQGQAVVQLSNDTLQTAIQTAQNSLEQARVNLATQTNANTDQRNQLNLQVSSAQAALASAQQTYAANQKLYAIGGVSQTELNSSKSAVDAARASLASAQTSLATNGRAKSETLAGLQLSVKQAEASLAQAQQNAANATVRAPFAGQISAIAVSQGENVSSGGTVFTLVGAKRQVNFNVAPGDAGALKAGTVVPFKVNQQTYQVKLDQNPPAPANSVVAVSARLLGGGAPSVGAVGTVSYKVPVASGTLVPSAAVQTDGTQSYVFVYQGGKATRQNVTVLGQSGDQSAVSGLSANSVILSSPPEGLLDGASVTVGAGAGGAGGPGSTGGRGARNGGGAATSSATSSGSRQGYRRRQGATGAAPGGQTSGTQAPVTQIPATQAPAARQP